MPRVDIKLTMRAIFYLVLLALLIYTATGVEANTVPEPEEYRLEDYDAPVPEGLKGAITVDAIEVKDLVDNQDALVIDVIPEHRKPDFLPENQLWIPPAHLGIPGAVWLPDIGYGALSETTISYFKKSLEKHTKDKAERPIVFYCRIDCWMSWNAAKRALTFGYKQIYWFADGINGWDFEDYELQPLQVEPGVRQ